MSNSRHESPNIGFGASNEISMEMPQSGLLRIENLNTQTFENSSLYDPTVVAGLTPLSTLGLNKTTGHSPA